MILKWTTATETNNMGYNIFRDGEAIGYVPGSGTTTEPREYTFIDENLPRANYLFELIQIDYDGTTQKVGELEVILNEIPSEYILEQNYPNPFNPNTKINYALPKDALINLSIYNSLGERITILEEGLKEAGYYQIDFNGSNLPSGIYFYTLSTDNFTTTKKMILLK